MNTTPLLPAPDPRRWALAQLNALQQRPDFEDLLRREGGEIAEAMGQLFDSVYRSGQLPTWEQTSQMCHGLYLLGYLAGRAAAAETP